MSEKPKENESTTNLNVNESIDRTDKNMKDMKVEELSNVSDIENMKDENENNVAELADFEIKKNDKSKSEIINNETRKVMEAG